MAHAVGLDALASVQALVEDLHGDGYAIDALTDPLEDMLQNAWLSVSLADYNAALGTLPATLRTDLIEAWGPPENDANFRDGAFHFAAVENGNALIALQPERGQPQNRDDDYHDLSRTPRHAYVAFYLYLRGSFNADALIHVGAHGTLEWLPGKSVALSDTCWPEALTASLPVIYPFIVNDPGEAAQAKRRIGAMTLGHIPPALKDSETPERMAGLESLLDEFSNADGLDPKRRDRLQADIRDQAKALGVEGDLGISDAISTAEAITRIDRFVCDIKESQFGDGLHIWGRKPHEIGSFDPTTSVSSEKQSLLDALRGKRSLGDGEAYAQSKLALTMWSFALARELGDAGPAIIAVNPGSLLATKMVKDAYGVAGNDLRIGADILVRAALDDEFADASGRYYDNDNARFADPHYDALDPNRTGAIVSVIEEVISTHSPKLAAAPRV